MFLSILWNSFFSISSFFEGVTSIPPPNQSCVVQIYLVLKCIAGIRGFFICITTEIPEAQKLGFFLAPRIFFWNLLGNLPYTLEKFTPTLSKTFPFFNILYSPPPSSFFLFLFQVVDLNSILLFSSSIILSQNAFCNVLNQLLAKFFFVSKSILY